jgi:hypothetical protein
MYIYKRHRQQYNNLVVISHLSGKIRYGIIFRLNLTETYME